MRRNHVLALFTMVALGVSATSHAQAMECGTFAKSKCQKLLETESQACQTGRPGNCKPCCEPPPCEFYYQLAMYKMLQAMFADASVVGCAKNGNVESTVGELGKTPEFQAALPNCSGKFEGHAINFPPGLSTGADYRNTKQCDITATDTGLITSIESAQRGYSTCAELLDVIFAHEAVHMAICNAMQGKGQSYAAQSQAAVAREEVRAYQASINSLMKELREWPTKCSVVKDTKQALNDAKAAIAALKGTAAGGRGVKCP